jgi:hypothetical protein
MTPKLFSELNSNYSFKDISNRSSMRGISHRTIRPIAERITKKTESKFKNAVELDDEYSLNTQSMVMCSDVEKSGDDSSKSLKEMVQDIQAINKSIKDQKSNRAS